MNEIVENNIKTHICHLKEEIKITKKDARKARLKLLLLSKHLKLFNKLINKNHETK